MTTAPNTYTAMLAQARTIAVVGLSDKPDRSSYGVTEYMKRHYEIIPVNPQLDSWQGITAYPSLLAIPKEKRVDIVNIFRKGSDCPDVVKDAIAIGAKGIWLQQGIISPEAEQLAQAASIPFVMDACIAVLHRQMK
jgi:hypothetical protein